jgi:hypothetical protein
MRRQARTTTRRIGARLAAAALAAAAALSTGARAAATATDTTPVLLEPPRQRQGYYLALGLAGIGNYNREEGVGLGVWPGYSTTIRLGQLVTRRFGLGLLIDSGSASKGTEKATLFTLGIEAQWELVHNLAVHGGVGLGVVGISDSTMPDADLRGAFGAAYSLGLSYEWFPFSPRETGSGGLAFTPFVEVRLIPGTDVISQVTLIGVQATWWTGLPRNQLELPPDKAFVPVR